MPCFEESKKAKSQKPKADNARSSSLRSEGRAVSLSLSPSIHLERSMALLHRIDLCLSSAMDLSSHPLAIAIQLQVCLSSRRTLTLSFKYFGFISTSGSAFSSDPSFLSTSFLFCAFSASLMTLGELGSIPLRSLVLWLKMCYSRRKHVIC